MNFRTLDLNLLRVFDAVMAEGNLTRAAEQLALTQPAVSHALKRLRESVGEELLVRTAHGVRPTEHAQALWPQVRAALQALQQALAPSGFDPLEQGANFRLAMADATAALLMPAMVAEIERIGAQVNLRVLPLTTRDPGALLERGDVDAAVGSFPALITAMMADEAAAQLHHQRLYDTEYVCVMRKGHPLAKQPLTLETFCAAHHLRVSFSGRPHGVVDEALTALGRTRRVVLTTNQFFTAGRVVTQSDLLTVLPAHFVAATGYQAQLVTQPIPLPLGSVHVEVVWHARNDVDPAHRWLRAALVAAAGQRAGMAPRTDRPNAACVKRG
ncbi:MAG: LysR family transcriptional regulator [Burkholderiales bacterium]